MSPCSTVAGHVLARARRGAWSRAAESGSRRTPPGARGDGELQARDAGIPSGSITCSAGALGESRPRSEKKLPGAARTGTRRSHAGQRRKPRTRGGSSSASRTCRARPAAEPPRRQQLPAVVFLGRGPHQHEPAHVQGEREEGDVAGRGRERGHLERAERHALEQRAHQAAAPSRLGAVQRPPAAGA